MKDGSDLKQEDMMAFIEGKVWSPSYLNLGYFVFFSKFCNWSCLTRTRSQASGINIGPQLLQQTCLINQSNQYLYFLAYANPRSRSRIDLGEFFVQAGLHQLIDLRLVCKYPSRLVLLLVRLHQPIDLLQVVVQVSYRFVSLFVRLHQLIDLLRVMV